MSKAPKLPGLRTCDIELAVAKHFGWRHNIIVPNVSWGLGFRHELDLLVYTGSGKAWEVEIKVSKQDLLRDALKAHQHRSEFIHRLYFAVPETLQDLIQEIPERAGFIVCRARPYGRPQVNVVRPARLNPGVKPWPDSRVRKLLELASMRVWTLKEHLYLKKYSHKRV